MPDEAEVGVARRLRRRVDLGLAVAGVAVGILGGPVAVAPGAPARLVGIVELGAVLLLAVGADTIVAELAEDDRGASGASFELPELSKVLELARTSAFDVLVVRELDRLSRRLAKQLIVEMHRARINRTFKDIS